MADSQISTTPVIDSRKRMDARTFGRFINKILIGDGCWEWQDSIRGGGYGQFHAPGGRDGAHRVSYKHFIGVIPDGLDLDHLCRNRSCVNPRHLEPVTRRENLHRGEHQNMKIHVTNQCKYGHDLSQEINVYRDRTGGRQCRPCTRAYTRRRLASLRAASLCRCGEPIGELSRTCESCRHQHAARSRARRLKAKESRL